MRMSADYQPKIINLLASPDPTTSRHCRSHKAVAKCLFPSQDLKDPKALKAAVMLMKGMPYKVLKKHGIVDFDKESVWRCLKTKGTVLKQKHSEHIACLCKEKIDDFYRRKDGK